MTSADSANLPFCRFQMIIHYAEVMIFWVTLYIYYFMAILCTFQQRKSRIKTFKSDSCVHIKTYVSHGLSQQRTGHNTALRMVILLQPRAAGLSTRRHTRRQEQYTSNEGNILIIIITMMCFFKHFTAMYCFFFHFACEHFFV